jgi:hypothetical protein
MVAVERTMADKKSGLEWQIDARSRIQRLMFDLYAFLDRYSEFPNENSELRIDEQELCWTNMAWMVDAAFSLWRSAFLTDAVRDRRVVYEHMKDFMKRLLEVNTITFADDHRMRALSVGYYNANARYRLERLYSNNPVLLEKHSIQALDQLKKEKVDLAKQDQSKLWDVYFEALLDTFNWFHKDWKTHMRPSRGLDRVVQPNEAAVSEGDGSKP